MYQTALRLGEGQFAGFCDTAFLAGLNLDPVNHDLDGVLVGLFQLDLVLADHLGLAVHQYSGETFPFDPVDDLLVGAFLSSHHRRKDLDLGILVHGHDRIGHLVHGLRADGPAADRTVRLADPGIEKPQIVVYLRHCAHGGSGVVVGGLLVDGDGRAQTLYVLHVGLLHLAQELPGVG